MDQEIYKQIIDQFAKTGRILIVLPKNLTPDNVASAGALFLFLRHMNKEVDVISELPVPEVLRFLPGSQHIQSQLAMGKHLVIRVDTTTKPIDEVSYQETKNSLDIYVKSKAETFSPSDVSFVPEATAHGLVVVLDCESLEDTGKILEQYADALFEAPKINIDTKPGNKYFGAINLVDINAASISEILAELFAAFEQQLIDEDIATSLLAGIISKTNSFQHTRTSPKSFLKASELVALGGRQQEVVNQLYKTKPLSVLRLWGRVLARLKALQDSSILYSLVNVADFEKSEASSSDLPSVLFELLDNISDYDIVGLLAEQDATTVEILLALRPSVPLSAIAAKLGSMQELPNMHNQHKIYRIHLANTSLTEAENKFSAAIS